MNIRVFLRFGVVVLVFWVQAAVMAESASSAGGAPHWEYDGEHGPSHWGALDPRFSACQTGSEQSPIDLRWSKPQVGRALQMDTHAGNWKIIDNGHTIQVNFDPGNRLSIQGDEYELIQMHFHSRSEHTLSGKSFPLELHFVHKNTAGKLAVVGVMFKPGKSHPALERIWSKIPQEKGKEIAVTDLRLDPSELLPAALTHYHYAGSLTTPPCSEGVNWNVLNTPVEASQAQIEAFRRLYPKNNRPIQPLHGRKPVNY